MIEWHVGDVVKKLREERKWKQRDLALQAGIPRTATISHVEKTGKYDRETVEKIARAFDQTVGEIHSQVPSVERKPAPFVPSSHPEEHAKLDRIMDSGDERLQYVAKVICELLASAVVSPPGTESPSKEPKRKAG